MLSDLLNALPQRDPVEQAIDREELDITGRQSTPPAPGSPMRGSRTGHHA
ncbi:MAG TPA: hypothetical protein VF931_05770 [Steroidobacteraceae bacterium]